MNKDELIAVLEMITRYSHEYLRSLDKEQLEQMLKERSYGQGK